MTYNVHSCRGIDGLCSPERIAAVISAAKVDVACLQEIDVGRHRTGGIDQARRIAEILSMDFHFNPLIEEATGRYGDAIISKSHFTVIRAEALPAVPRPLPNEKRGAIWIETTLDGQPCQIINTHFGLGRQERRLQATALLADWIEPALRRSPVILCGDFNSRPGSHVHALLSAKLRDTLAAKSARHPHTFSTRIPFVCLDYIYASEALTARRAGLFLSPPARKASDHFPLLADLSV